MKIGEGIKNFRPDCGEQLCTITDDQYSELREVIEVLHDDGVKILMLWDGFDKPLGAGTLTRNLWDQLRELASIPALRLVTATRRNLHTLIRSNDSAGSDFWNIFDMNPLRVDAFDELDRRDIMASLGTVVFKPGAETELDNWTSGYPPLYLAVVNQIVSGGSPAGIDIQTVNKAADETLDSVTSILNDLWGDCPEPAKELYRHLIEYGTANVSGIDTSEISTLVEKGFAQRAGEKIMKRCRLLERHVANLGEEGGSMMRLFGPWEKYRENVRGLLELRLGHLSHIDDRLRRLIGRTIEDIPEYPNECVANIRGIADHALDLIWDAEFGTNHDIPAEWVPYWERNGHICHDVFTGNKVPPARGHQCRLLQLATGAADRIERKTRYVSKSTYVLLNAVQRFGDFGQHLDNVDVHLGTAVAAISNCLELAASLERELPK